MIDNNFENIKNKKDEILKEENKIKIEKKTSFDLNIEEDNTENNPFNFIEFTDDDLFNSTEGDEIFNSSKTQSDIFRNNENIKYQTMIMKNPFLIKNDNPFNYFFQDNTRTKSPNQIYKFNVKKSLGENMINSNENNFMFYLPINQNNFVNDNVDNKYLRNNINRRTIIYRNNNYDSLLNKNLINNNDKIRPQTMKIKKSKNLSIQIEIYLSELDKYLQIIGFINYNIFNNIKQKLYHLIKTQSGSRILQNYLEKTPSQIIHLLFNEISGKINNLLLDPYANYFCLKLFCFLNNNDRLSFLSIIVKNICIFSINKISTYPIQFIVSHLYSKIEMQIIINQINKNLMKLALDIYGTHVIEKIIINFNKEYLKEIFNFITENLIFLSKHVNGLCLVKRILIIEYENNNYLTLKNILINKSLELIENPYGNYALQIVIDYWNNNDIYDICKQFFNRLTEFSCMKYSSNVIERCIEKNEKFLNGFILEICIKKNTIGNLIKNSYGNYVVQTALKFAKGIFKIYLVHSIENNLNILGEKKLIYKWKHIIALSLIDCELNINNFNNENES